LEGKKDNPRENAKKKATHTKLTRGVNDGLTSLPASRVTSPEHYADHSLARGAKSGIRLVTAITVPESSYTYMLTFHRKQQKITQKTDFTGAPVPPCSFQSDNKLFTTPTPSRHADNVQATRAHEWIIHLIHYTSDRTRQTVDAKRHFSNSVFIFSQTRPKVARCPYFLRVAMNASPAKRAPSPVVSIE